MADDTVHRPVLRSLGSLVVRRRQLLRYAAVSAISTLTSLTVLGLLVGVSRVGAVAANLAATAVGTVPSFELNRRWVWSRSGRLSVGREVVPFCALSFTGLLLSTVTVRAASALSARSGPLLHTAAVELANVGAYGSLWVLQFVLLDRVLFAGGRGRAGREEAINPHARTHRAAPRTQPSADQPRRPEESARPRGAGPPTWPTLLRAEWLSPGAGWRSGPGRRGGPESPPGDRATTSPASGGPGEAYAS
jgi:putative flippase GtrA